MDIAIENYERTGAIGINVYNNLFSLDSWGVGSIDGSFTLERGKSSVNTGKFTPGIYRVNPYHVKGRTVLLKDGDISRANFLNAAILPQTVKDYCAGQPLYLARETIDGKTHEYYTAGDWWKYRFVGQADALFPLLDQEDSHRQLALQKAYAKCDSFDLDLGTVLGEYRETIQTIRSPLKSLRKFLLKKRARNLRLLLALARGDRRTVVRIVGKKAAASTDVMASTWLEIRYGIRPLVMLVQEVIERVNKSQKRVLDPTVIRTARSRMTFGPYYNRTEMSADRGNTCVECDLLVEDTYSANASVAYRLTRESCVSDTLGLTPRFLPELMWELTTCSFVVDWLVSVGDWLGTLRIKPHIEVLGNTSGYKIQRKFKFSNAEIGHVDRTTRFPISWRPYWGSPPPDDVRVQDDFVVYNEYERKVDLNLQWYPHFTWGRTIDLWKVIDSVSLIWQFAKNVKR